MSRSAACALLLPWAVCALSAGLALSNVSVEVRSSSFLQRRLRGQERRDVQREILSILGLPHRPRPLTHTTRNAAPAFMLDLYNTVSTEAEARGFSYYKAVLLSQASAGLTPQDRGFLDDADTVMSFMNLSECPHTRTHTSTTSFQHKHNSRSRFPLDFKSDRLHGVPWSKMRTNSIVPVADSCLQPSL